MTHFASRLTRVGLRSATCLALLGCLVAPARAVVVHNYLFNSGDGTQIIDSVGSADGTAIDGAVVDTAAGRLVLDGVTAYGDLPAATIAINTYTTLSLEMWLTVDPSAQDTYTMAGSFGRVGDPEWLGDEGETEGAWGYDYIMIQPTRGGTQGSRLAVSAGTRTSNLGPWDAETGVTDGDRDLSDGLLHHIVATIDSTTLSYYVDGVQIGTAPMEVNDGDGGTMPITLADVSNDLAYIGKSVYNDPFMGGSVFEYRIYDNILSETDVEDQYTAGCDGCGAGPVLMIDRDTGEAEFSNDLGSQNMVRYSLASAAGALDPDGWDPITDSGLDPDDDWEILSSEKTLLAEEDPLGGGGPDDGIELDDSVPIGAPWTKSPFEDLTATILVWDGVAETELTIPVIFTGNGDESFSRSDFNVDGVIDADDYTTLLANHLTDLGSELAIDTFALGDVDGDLDNDFDDFRLFKGDFIAANGAEAFAALTGAAVPEPTSLLLALSAVAFLGRRRA